MTYQQFDRVYLCTMAQFKQQRYGGGAAETYSADDEATIDFYIQEASRLIVDDVLHQLPLPYTQTMLFDAPHAYEDGRTMGYDFRYSYVLHTSDEAPLLTVTTLTNGDGDTISSANYKLYPANRYPKMFIRILNNSTDTFDYVTTWEQAISVAGVFGYVPHYDNAWFDSGKDVPTGDINASVTTITFATASDASQFSAGDYIRIDSEVMLVTDSNSNTGVITIDRAQLGSTAAAHTAATDIEQFRQNQQIMSATCQLASAMFNKDRGFYDGGTPSVAESIDEIRQRLAAHTRYNV